MQKIHLILGILFLTLVTLKLSSQSLVQSFVETNISGNSGFGNSISNAGDLNGDHYDDIIIGAAGYLDIGAAFIYFGGGTGVDELPDLVLIGELSNISYGGSVSGAGDINGDGYDDVIVGAPSYNNFQGRIYIYYGSTNMDNVADLTITGPDSGQFGCSVSSTGDVNGDNYDDVIVGAQWYGSERGRAYIYFGGSTIDNIADVVMTGEEVLLDFGNLVSGAGDVNGDGWDDVLIGAYRYNSRMGKAYIFFGGSSMNNIPDVTMTGAAIENMFAASLSNAGDVNGDNYDDVIIGAYGYDSQRGRAYIYYGGTNMNNIADVILTGEASGNNFGYSVSNAGNVNGDAYDDVIVGAFAYGTNQTGRAYIFNGGLIMFSFANVVMTGNSEGAQLGRQVCSVGNFIENQYSSVLVISSFSTNYIANAYVYKGGNPMNNVSDMTITEEPSQNDFGISVSSAGDVNGDNYDDIIVGAPRFNLEYGRAYIYYGGPNMDNIADVILSSSLRIGFGYSVSTAGDVNGDNFDDVIVGSNVNNVSTGKAFIFYGGSNMDNTADVTFNGESSDYSFGLSVSDISDVNADGFDDVIVGACINNNNTGKAYIYFGGNPMNNIADLTMVGEATSNYFGCSVSQVGDINNDNYSDFIVGAYGFSNNTGRAYIYYGGPGLDNVPDIILTGGAIHNYFGCSVSDAGNCNGDAFDDVVVGAYGYSSNTGRAYVYFGNNAMDNNADVIMTGETVNSYFGRSVSSGGKMTNDSFDDIIIGAYGYNLKTGRAYVYFGDYDMDNIPDVTLTGNSANNYFGYSVSSSGNINGDGFNRVLVGAYNFPSNGKSYLYLVDLAPSVTTQAASNIDSNKATGHGEITYMGSKNITAHGFCWNTTGSPTTLDSKISMGSVTATGPFEGTFSNLAPGTTYYLRAYATNSVGTAYGNEISFTTPKLDQSINFNDLSIVTYGITPYNLNATASSGLSITFSSSNTDVATVSGNIISINGAGTTILTASQIGNNTYNPAPNVQQTLTVNKASLTVSADNKSKIYGSINPSFSLSYNGFVNGDTTSDLTTLPIASCSANSETGAGIVPILVSGGSAENYEFLFVNGTLTINKASLKVVAENKTKIYGSENPELTLQYNGWVNGPEVIDSEPIRISDVTAESGVGTYPISLSGGSDNNYTFTFTNGTLTVEKAMLTVIALDTVLSKGGIINEFRYLITGFVNGDDTSVVIGIPLLTANYESANVGDEIDILIDVSQMSASNYNFTGVNGKLIILINTSSKFEDMDNIQIFPNPVTNGRIFIKTGSNIQNALISLINLQGILLLTRKNEGMVTELDIQKLSTGTYLIHIKTDKGVIVKQVIKI